MENSTVITELMENSTLYFQDIQNNKAEDQQGIRRLEQHYKEHKFNKHL